MLQPVNPGVLPYAEARMSVTFVKRNKPTDKSWQVTLQGKVRPSNATVSLLGTFCLSSLYHTLRHIHLLMFPFAQAFKESGHGGPHVETQEEVAFSRSASPPRSKTL